MIKTAEFIELLDELIQEVDNIGAEHGFNQPNPNKGEMIALMHSELSECLEALRCGNPPDLHCNVFSGEEVELADVIIRILHYSARFNLRIGSAILAKVAFNRTRPFKHGKQF